MDDIRFGIVGCGKIFDRHAKAIRAIPGAHLKAISDKNADRLREAKEKYGADVASSDYVEMLRDPSVDVVVICTPSGLHAQMAMAALEHGKHVLCEKPLAMTVKDAQSLNTLAKKKELHLFEVKQNRYSPVIHLLRQAVTEGWLGKLLLGNATVRWNRTQEYYKQADWFGTLEMDGGVILNQAIHHIDLLVWMMGKPTSVIAIAKVLNHDIEAPDTAMGIVQFESGSLGNLEFTTCAAPKNIEGSITIMGDKGTIKIGGKSLDAFEIWEVEGHAKPEVSPVALSNHARLYQDIVALFPGKTINALINGDEALKSLLVAEAMFISSQSHCEILIDHESGNFQKCSTR